MQEPAVAPASPESQSTTHMVYALMQFALAVRQRKHVVIAALLLAGLLGGLYFATATRLYSAKAQLLVMQTGADVMNPTLDNSKQTMMPTYVGVISTAKVLQGALTRLRPEECIDLEESPKERWPDALRRGLTAKSAYNTNIIEIEYRSRDPNVAVAVVNSVVDSYLNYMDTTHKGTALAILQILTNEKLQLEQQINTTNQELQQAYREVGHLASSPDDRLTHPVVQRAIAINESLIDATKKRIELQALMAAVEESIARGEDLQQHIMTVADVAGRDLFLSSLGFNTTSGQTQMYLERAMLEDQAELERLRKDRLPNHPAILALEQKVRLTEQYLLSYQDRLRDRIAELRATELGPMIVNMLRQKISEAQQREAMYYQQYDDLSREASQLNSRLAQIKLLEAAEKRYRDMYERFINKVSDIQVKQEGPDIRTDVVSKPEVNNVPISPNLKRVLLMVLVGGLGAGLMAVYVLDTLDDRFRSIEEMEQQLGAPVLAVVRPLKAVEQSGLDALQIHVQPDSAESEAFRTMRTALSLTEHPSMRLVVTSSEPGDGKTTVLANLAVAYAQSGKRTLLIDADLRRPGLTALLACRGAEGLSTIIGGEEEVAGAALRCIRASGVDGLDVLPSGPRPSNPAELLGTPTFAHLLAWAESVYDQILIDSPPTLAASDTAIVGRLVDGVVLVVQPEKNRRRLVTRAAASLSALKITLLGVVINRVGADGDNGYYGGYAYDYDYSGESHTADETPKYRLVGAEDEELDGAAAGAEQDRSDSVAVRRRAV